MWDLATRQFSRPAVLALIFAVVVLAVMVVAALVGNRLAITRRLAATAPANPQGGTMASLRTTSGRDAWTRIVDTIEKRGLSLVDTNNAALAARLAAAGFSQPQAP